MNGMGDCALAPNTAASGIAEMTASMTAADVNVHEKLGDILTARCYVHTTGQGW